MSEMIERLKSIGAQRIHEDTHIAKMYVVSILNESYDGLTKIQFNGFISILEREYSLDLSELHRNGAVFFDENSETETETSVFIEPKKAPTYTALYIGIVVVLVVAVMLLKPSSNSNKIVDNSNPIVEKVKKEVEAKKEVEVQEKIVEAEIQKVEEVEEEIIPEVIAPTSITILPKTKVWVGVVNIATNQKIQKNLRDSMELNASKEYLMLFGHGLVKVKVGEVVHDFKDSNTLRLKYVDGNLTKIGISEFKNLNRGKKW